MGLKKIHVPNALNNAENAAKAIKENQAKLLDIPIEIRRQSDCSLFIDIGECETLSFKFKSVKEIKNEERESEYSYTWATLSNDGKTELDEGYKIDTFPQNEIYYCSSFCKTQFANNVVQHKWVADIIKVVASHCLIAEVYDEGDYYHAGNLEDASAAIAENGKLIDSISGLLCGYQLIKGGQTKIKPLKKRKKSYEIFKEKSLSHNKCKMPGCNRTATQESGYCHSCDKSED
ncbi:hypothetical protein [Niastella populi]|uniref:hypothetical protein n=1 Tax=Niastella populi TaxID=550983 RepID=UPI001056A186|nr:hypothetical protein [Niastella populi]